ncbi:YALI0A14806p [Yarrowia lipolytica CLIB122]|uniref:mitochondrial processing peptidase n=2 Tax=Yarrowia lipolytica TaxID=4952 RepID=Q6CGY9_YARLI|nr:YALI0A14806p [Yarrowia lipolytica CLIB122]8AB6_A Chain A, YALI0A14806p [Yarrowia lipolytica]8AB6_L Chain L, YALI0A14806p [Yarrowia lipolytica]8AB7_A Chain A, YALI0A14806p [Yarrowia lipolytica]8AB7_L Chain L, YALI0A14806p [Yarrowia lipolytica]8AB8_A Chain A, YALI0A14806p [Yarrowia lipolytica]8AB8_L Chain L, YALI0A14806p [Yarrowia lipolytica]8AB9_A Chain A, YALI0A14806p [Yarrowia lipolytica]8AB9_L Chain L, YALI0A14806p [Yarrowia lipolytica]8ABA_A Chain A, YALI0A14806p [Yarrowia lipolytica|eukprot:XP_500073.1 YALI0A14806p [Yarrowia lipolytica CLIB122]
MNSLLRLPALKRGVFTMSKRGLATTVSPKTRTSNLKNGLTIASESNPLVQTATVGVWIDAGSRNENAYNNGTAHFFEHLAFKGTDKRSQHQLELDIENMGGHLNAYTSRESTVYYAKSFKDDVPKSVEILADILQHSKLAESAIDREREVITRELEEVNKQYEEVVFDHLHATAFMNQPLGRTILGPRENIQTITNTELRKFITENYTADRMVLVGAGAVDHDALVELAEKYFSHLPSSQSPVPLGTPRSSGEDANQNPIPNFVGSEVRLRDDTMPVAHIAIAVEGVSWTSEDYYTALVAQAIIGNYDRAVGTSRHQGSRLSNIVSENNLANSFQSFSTSYSDTGLWGIYLTSENTTQIDDLVHFTLKEWNRLSTSVSNLQVERAKSQLKAGLLLSLDGTTYVAEDIGRQLTTLGRRVTPAEVEAKLEAVTEHDVRAWAQKTLYDKDIALVGLGPIEGLYDYNRIRNDMSMMRW